MDKYADDFVWHITKAYEMIDEIQVVELERIDVREMAKHHLIEAIKCMGLEKPRMLVRDRD